MKTIKIHFVNQVIIKNNIDLDAYKAAINSAFDDSYIFEFVVIPIQHGKSMEGFL